MSSNDLGDDYVDNAEITFHVCARCIAWLAAGNWRYLGLVGCSMPVPIDENAALLEEFMGVGILKCFRCWNKGQTCCVVSRNGPC
jgi:hypothetical protein